MAYTSESARRQLLDELGQAVEHLSVAIEALGQAYEAADDHSAEELEVRLFRPAQAAYGRARRTGAGFAERHGLTADAPIPPPVGAPSADPRVHLERAIQAIEQADLVISEMQDSMLPVEVGDRELRDGLTEVRELLAAAPGQGRQLVRMIGR
jgi:hypothetical protein